MDNVSDIFVKALVTWLLSLKRTIPFCCEAAFAYPDVVLNLRRASLTDKYRVLLYSCILISSWYFGQFLSPSKWEPICKQCVLMFCVGSRLVDVNSDVTSMQAVYTNIAFYHVITCPPRFYPTKHNPQLIVCILSQSIIIGRIREEGDTSGC